MYVYVNNELELELEHVVDSPRGSSTPFHSPFASP